MEEVANIENDCISLTTKRRYHTTLFSFIIWAYYNLLVLAPVRVHQYEYQVATLVIYVV